MQYALSKIRSAARELLTREEKDETRQFQGEAMLRRMVRLGLLLDTERKLDYVLGLTTAKLMERRLQTKVTACTKDHELSSASVIRHRLCVPFVALIPFVMKPRSTYLLFSNGRCQVFKQGLAKSIHHARVLIRQRHIRVGRQICDIPSLGALRPTDEKVE